jgi:hypothetical protein
MRAHDDLRHQPSQAGQATPQRPDHLPRLLPTGFAAGPARLAEHCAR